MSDVRQKHMYIHLEEKNSHKLFSKILIFEENLIYFL